MLSPRRRVAIVVAGWAAVTWGGRIALLAGNEPLVDRARIGGSVLVALVLASVWGVERSGNAIRWSGWAYVVWNLAIWGSSLVSVWIHVHPFGFKVVHTGLALVSFLVVSLVVRHLRFVGLANENASLNALLDD